jgi:superfamily II RNA helicase
MSTISTETLNSFFQDIRVSYQALVSANGTPDQSLLKTWINKVSTTLSQGYYTSFQNLMDDSGLSEQPFWIEGDSWLLSILADPRFDVNSQALILAFTNAIETKIHDLTEGGRKVEFLFFKTHGNVFVGSPYLNALRQIAKAYIKHTLSIQVYDYEAPDLETLMSFYNRKAPLFTFIYMPIFSTTQIAQINTLYTFGQASGSKFDLDQFTFKINGFALFLASNEQRAARMNEMSSLDGMLQALLITYHGVPDQTNFSCTPVLSAELDKLYYPVPEPVTIVQKFCGGTVATLFDKISTQLFNAKIESNRVATLIAIFCNLYAGQANLTPTQEQFIVLALFHALFCDMIPLQQRPQPYVNVTKNKALFSVTDNIFPLFTAMSEFATDLYELDADAITVPCAAALGDIYDGSLMRSLLLSTHAQIVAQELQSEQFKSIIQIACQFIKCLSADAIQNTVTIVEKNAEDDTVIATKLTADLRTEIPDYFVNASGEKVISPAAYAAIQWNELPVIDSQILKVLLYSIGDNGSIYQHYKDNQHLKAPIVSAKATQKAEVLPEPDVNQEDLGGWDDEPEDQADMDDWDAQSIPEEKEVVEEWDAEEPVGAVVVAVAPTVQINPHPQLLGGNIILKDVIDLEQSAKYWDTHQMVGDGSTMQTAEKESLFIHNPIILNRDLKNACRTLLNRYSNRSDPKNPYPLPPDDKIKTLCSVSGPMLTFEKAKTWLTITSQNLTMKYENSRITKANSTKKEYNQSMITPSRVVLRDIVATEEVGDVPSLLLTKEADSKDDGKAKAPKGGKKNQPQKESVQEKVARETQEKQAKADLDKVVSIISTCRQPSLAARINELDRKLLAHGDLPSALHGLMTLLNWRVQLWHQQVEGKGGVSTTPTATTSAAASAQIESHMDVAVRLLQLLMDLARRFLHIMTKEQLEKVKAAYAMLGFFESEIEIQFRWENATGRARHTTAQIAQAVAKNESISKSTAERRFSVGMSRAQFLLQYSGHILLRNVKSAKDHRVDGFYPDKWQRELLDIVDANESALVVAPTSAGKTLVSFYTVEHVLRQNKEESEKKNLSNDKKGVVVFVAPTFPLARQMEADISNRNKEAIVVIHDSNQKLPNLKFDVLITIPNCLENLLTSPSRIEWATRIRYIVFDEVHSIGSTLHGPTWERLLLLAHQTPFLALSATVGGVEHFRDWLINVRAKYVQGESGLAKNAPIIAQTALTQAQQPSPRVHHISTSVRWSHLHHYFYIPPKDFFVQALAELQKSSNLTVAAIQPPSTSDGFVPLHPVAALSLNSSTSTVTQDGSVVTQDPSAEMKAKLGNIDERALKGLFNVEFSSSDALQLHNSIASVLSKSPRFAQIQNGATSPTNNQDNVDKLLEIQAEVERLNPDVFFGFFVEKIHVLEYEHELKCLLLKLYQAVCDTEIATIITSLSEDIQQILQPLSMATRARQDLWKRQFLPLLRSLQQRDWFPAIIFCLDRTLCTELLTHVVEELEAEEHAAWVKENNKRLDKKAREREYEAALKAAKRLRDNRGKGSAEAQKELEEEIRMGLVDPSILNPDAMKNLKPYNPEDWNADPPDERFSFVKETEWMSEDVRAYWERRLNRKRGKETLNGQHPLVKALYRGFGVHHYGVDKQYRDLVEILFRQRHLKFVISIETLGLGVNMPCRTTVFAFTTVALNPLNYRQMSGRAGRRGFDDKGQVIFFGIDPYHAGRLMTSSLTPLRGHYNLSCSIVLRLCLKFFFAKETQSALNQIVNTTITTADGVKHTVPVNISQNNGTFDQMAFLSRSFFTFSEQFPQHVRIQLLHHFRFCLTYFQYLQLFNHNAPSGLAYLLSAISNVTGSTTSSKVPSYINDAGAFAFIYLLRTGALDRLCENFDTDQEGTATKVMALLCHLFFPLRLRSGSTRADYPAGSPLAPGLSPGHVVLPPLAEIVSKDIDDSLKEHDKFVVQLFSRYALAVSSTTHAIAESQLSTANDSYHSLTTMMAKDEFTLLQDQSQEVIQTSNCLPHSSKSPATNPQLENQLVKSLTKTAISSSIRTPFHTLSTSKGDTFTDAYDLLNSVSRHVDLRASQLPINVDRYSPNPTTFSSYALDFFINGNYDDVILVHGIHKAEAWATLMSFSKLLQTLKKSLAILSSSADEDNDDEFDESGQADDDNDDEEDTINIFKKSSLYQNNQYIKDHLYITPGTISQHRRVARCFKFVFKTFFHNFTSISRDKNVA